MAEINGIRRGNNFKDITGMVFGRLTVQRFARINNDRQANWLCRCECGNECEVRSRFLLAGKTKSCGCIQRDNPSAKTHGMSHTAENATWRHIKVRCTNEQSADYALYGGRGITVCDRWLKSFAAFFEDMGPRPSSKHSIERLDVNGNYEKENCVWATAKAQARNRRQTMWIEYQGRTLSLAEHCEIAGKCQKMVWKRLKRGWTIDEAIETPLQKNQQWRKRNAELPISE